MTVDIKIRCGLFALIRKNLLFFERSSEKSGKRVNELFKNPFQSHVYTMVQSLKNV